MKVLVIGVYRDNSGWSKACIDMVLAMDAVGIDVVTRPLRFNNAHADIPQRITELENKSSKNCDICIQHIFPHLMVYNGKMKNIGLYASETTSIKYTGWPDRLNMMDDVFVFTQQMQDCAIDSGVTKPIHIIPQPCNIKKFEQSYPLHSFIEARRHGDFLFYTIADFNRRKNLTSLLKAFHLEFHRNEPVNLVLKISTFASSGMNSYDIDNWCKEIKDGLKLYKNKNDYKNEIILDTSYISDTDIASIHKSCDVFISTSYGEGWCIPCFDAMGFGKTPIATNWSAYKDYLDNDCGWLVNYNLEPVFGMQIHPVEMYYGHEEWAQISISHLRKCMREAYENKKLREEKSENGIEKIYQFSYENIGHQIEQVLNKIYVK